VVLDVVKTFKSLALTQGMVPVQKSALLLDGVPPELKVAQSLSVRDTQPSPAITQPSIRSPKGAIYTSPGQRPGFDVQKQSKP
jgi:hypothetical protein